MTKLFSDSDFASDIQTRRSVSGFVLMIGGGPVCWQSKRQNSIATSTMEAEYIALFEASRLAVWVTRLLRDLQVADELIGTNGMKVYTDNQSALALANGTNSTKAKNIDVAYHFTRRCVRNSSINVEYIPTKDMLADILTKPLAHSKAASILDKLYCTA